ncbi:hypothetical protein GOHSU_35_00190 [Gordonia hirsuta DSM 44140 = NBRC 16056]|uniref:PepSY domain-containing protein n=1 Tax=Gordonia hirsuta DSM 44140 = NBRC 16056 TaxID=1121927 RepID=L7LBC2_9ACTN|nr:PepSY-associated TM helix domain-containing protein [Gordonia hirsuta]GAC58224.1 hypothetical protein GOHSU_35_00190 [Gordonia hirsuta DSM 44140 = NBRC 16056]
MIVQRLLRRLHFYAGILVGPFLLIAAVSGGLYALAPSAEQLIYRTQLHTDSVGQPASIAAQVDAAMSARPDLTVTAVRPAPRPGDTTRVLFADPSLPESTQLAVFVDPVTVQVRGELATYGSGGALPVRTWIDRLHRDLHLGEPGRLYSELAASWLWVIALAGLFLWWFGRRKPAPRRPNARTRTRRWHTMTGLWIVVALLFLSATGLTWSRFAGENVAELRAALNWTQPTVSTSLTGQPAADGGAGHHGHGSPPAADDDRAVAADGAGYTDTALALARSAGVGIGEAVQITIPGTPNTAFTVTEVRAPWQFSPDTAVVDPAHDRVISVDRFADWPVAARLANLGIALHMGILFGPINQLALLLVAVALTAIIVLGYRMWWQRRPRGARRPGRAPTRGALAGLPWPANAAVLVTAAATGWFMPLLGWPLLAFLLLDLGVAGLGRRRAGAPNRAGSPGSVQRHEAEPRTGLPTRDLPGR